MLSQSWVMLGLSWVWTFLNILYWKLKLFCKRSVRFYKNSIRLTWCNQCVCPSTVHCVHCTVWCCALYTHVASTGLYTVHCTLCTVQYCALSTANTWCLYWAALYVGVRAWEVQRSRHHGLLTVMVPTWSGIYWGTFLVWWIVLTAVVDSTYCCGG